MLLIDDGPSALGYFWQQILLRKCPRQYSEKRLLPEGTMVKKTDNLPNTTLHEIQLH